LICPVRVRAASNWGRTRTRVQIFSEKILSRGMPCPASASRCDCSSWVRVLHRAYPIRMSAVAVSGTIGASGGVPGRQGCPGPRSAGGGHAQHLAEPGNLGEPSGVVGPGDRAGARTARRAGLSLAAGTRVALDVVGVAAFGVGHPECSHKHFSEPVRRPACVRTSCESESGAGRVRPARCWSCSGNGPFVRAGGGSVPVTGRCRWTVRWSRPRL
jgi:hypothetical protein